MITQNDTLIIQNARLTFAHLIKPQEPRAGSKGVAKYNVSFVLQANDPQIAEIDNYVNKIMEEKWPGSSTTLKPNLAKNQRFYGKGSEVINTKTMQVRDGFDAPGCMYYGGKNPERPAICDPATGAPIDPTNEMMIQQAATRLYRGCYATVEIDPYAFKSEDATGVFCSLVAVMFQAEGERLGGGGGKAASGFAPVEGAPPQLDGADTTFM